MFGRSEAASENNASPTQEPAELTMLGRRSHVGTTQSHVGGRCIRPGADMWKGAGFTLGEFSGLAKAHSVMPRARVVNGPLGSFHL